MTPSPHAMSSAPTGGDAAAPPFDPRVHFAHFYDHPVIRTLGAIPRWTISGMIGEDEPGERVGGAKQRPTRKAPIDARELIIAGRVRGAWSISEECLVDLDHLATAIPLAANCAYYLRAQEDGYAILDIEPGCPPQIAERLLGIPGALYVETSMSGRGFHLLVPLPENFHDHEIAARKRVLRERHGWYELLLNHWATFTRTPVTAARHEELRTAGVQAPASLEAEHRSSVEQLLASDALDSLESLYGHLAASAKAGSGASSSAVRTEVIPPEIPFGPEIVYQGLQDARHRLKTPDAFDHDLSRWEFSVLNTLYRAMEAHISAYRAIAGTYSPSDIAWLLYQAAAEVIPERPKHRELRNGRPFLLDRAASVVAERVTARQDRCAVVAS